MAKLANSTFQAIRDKDSSALGKIQYYAHDLFAAGAAFEGVKLIGQEFAEQTEEEKLAVLL